MVKVLFWCNKLHVARELLVWRHRLLLATSECRGNIYSKSPWMWYSICCLVCVFRICLWKLGFGSVCKQICHPLVYNCMTCCVCGPGQYGGLGSVLAARQRQQNKLFCPDDHRTKQTSFDQPGGLLSTEMPDLEDAVWCDALDRINHCFERQGAAHCSVQGQHAR